MATVPPQSRPRQVVEEAIADAFEPWMPVDGSVESEALSTDSDDWPEGLSAEYSVWVTRATLACADGITMCTAKVTIHTDEIDSDEEWPIHSYVEAQFYQADGDHFESEWENVEDEDTSIIDVLGGTPWHDDPEEAYSHAEELATSGAMLARSLRDWLPLQYQGAAFAATSSLGIDPRNNGAIAYLAEQGYALDSRECATPDARLVDLALTLHTNP